MQIKPLYKSALFHVALIRSLTDMYTLLVRCKPEERKITCITPLSLSEG
jgi:hypothetical protein